MPIALTLLLNVVLVVSAIALHYEALFHLDRMLRRLGHVASRLKVLIGLGITFITHLAQIGLFGLGYFVALKIDGMGQIIGETENLLMDCIYLSFVSYTTIGFGDIVAKGYVRYLTGVEALTGLILITWSASFLFLEMQKYWMDQRKNRP